MLLLYSNLKANHNKDYSVVKTSKAAQVAFFITNTKYYLQSYQSMILLVVLVFSVVCWKKLPSTLTGAFLCPQPRKRLYLTILQNKKPLQRNITGASKVGYVPRTGTKPEFG